MFEIHILDVSHFSPVDFIRLFFFFIFHLDKQVAYVRENIYGNSSKYRDFAENFEFTNERGFVSPIENGVDTQAPYFLSHFPLFAQFKMSNEASNIEPKSTEIELKDK